MHQETERVTIRSLGKMGRYCLCRVPIPLAAENAGLYVINAPGTLVKNIDISPLGDGAYTGVTFFQSPGSAILSCKIEEFPLGVFVEKSDRVAMIGNEIAKASSWGILVNNGQSAYVADNEISETGIGLWACDLYGTCERNNYHDNVFAGLLLCQYTGIFGNTFLNGPDLDAVNSATYWKVHTNDFTNNGEGVIVRDGSNHNFVNNNEYTDNMSYDISIPADETIQGINLFVPTAFENYIDEGQNVIIKDCGDNNTINGGMMVDTSVDPC